MALLFLEDDPWLLEHESCEKLQRNIMEHLTDRQQYPRTSDKYSKLSATIRLHLRQYNNEVVQLKQKLEVSSTSGSITSAEAERRARQIEVLTTKAIQMKRVFDDQVASKLTEDRGQLIGTAGSSNNWNMSGEQNVSVDELRQQQKRMLGEQEKGLESLSQIISRQKDIANTISNEVDLHNEILDDLGTQVDVTDQRIRAETQHVSVVDQKDNTCVYWLVILILLISIIVVAAL